MENFDKSIIYAQFSKDIQDPAELETVLSKFELQQFSKGTLLLNEGDKADAYYFVEEGFLRSFAIDFEGNDVTTNFYSRGNIVWEVGALFLGMPAIESLEVIKNTKLWVIEMKDFHGLFNGIKDFRESGRGRLVQHHIQLKKRTLALVTQKAETRYRNLIAEHPEIMLNIPLKYIASYLGLTNSSLSRIRKEINNAVDH